MRLTRLRERAFHTDGGGILPSICYNDAIRDDGQWSPSDSCEPRFTTANAFARSCFDRQLQPLAEGAAEIDSYQRPRDGRDGLRYLSSFQIFAGLMTPCSDLGRC